ncbi:sigma-54-dependent Fis family transcriptional regulator, partial [Candidatus Sumerlaeota bacterium]|nr:sigma-54-dependent Fis family transcriptional regulator [Candidatus Sumerlaeota bacterium]
ERDPDLDVIMMTAYASVETAVEALKKGASDYLIKPFHNEELVMLVTRLAETRGLKQENQTLKQSLLPAAETGNIIAASAPMQEVLKRAQKVAATDVSVLLRGESGTGKEVLATLIHASGRRKNRPFIRVNCGALPETLLESELFGHVRGAFTGAVETRKGLFQAADGGTIFLDEIGEVTPALQVKLLRVLQSGEFQRVGDPQTFKVDVRVIAATNRPLEDLIQSGQFRSDLYYRLNVVPVVIPPLRERKEDIPALIDHFLAKLRPERGRAKRVSKAAFELLMTYPWPGNIRELENAIEHAIVMSERDEIDPEDLPLAIQNASSVSSHAESAGAGISTGGRTLEEIEKKMLYDALLSTGFNHTRAAAKLGITRRTLGYRIDKYGLPRKAADEAEVPKPNGAEDDPL